MDARDGAPTGGEDLSRDSGASAASKARYHAGDVRIYDLLTPFQDDVTRRLVKRFASKLDLWNLRSFAGQSARQAAWNAATRLAPCLRWMRRYNVRTQLLPDIAAGVAVTFLIVPQGLSYSASIAGLPAIYGLYSDFLPLLLFAVYTTSQYLQVGAVAIVSLLTFNAIQDVVAPQAASVAALKAASAAASKAASAARGNATLAALSGNATAAFNAASVDLIQAQVNTAQLLAFFVGIFSLGIGAFKLGSVMNLMGPATISGFQTAASVTIAVGQFKNLLGYGKDFTTSTNLDDMVQGFIDWEAQINARSCWTGGIWLALLLLFKHLGRVERIKYRGVRVLRIFKITGPVLLCIIAIVSTKLAGLHLSPGCSYYDSVKNTANVFVPSAVAVPSAWNVSHKAITATDVLGHLVTYKPAPDAPGCVPMPKSSGVATYLNTTTPWGGPGNPWPRDRGLAITGTFGAPPTGRVPRFDLVNGKLLTGAIVVTLVSSLESIAIAKALVSKHRQRGFDPSQEFVALGMANLFGSFTGSYPISGSFSRSALNDEVGATSPVSVLVVGTLVGVTLKVASTVPIFYYLPGNALSAIVIVALMNLLDAEHFLWLARHDRKDAALWLTAFLAVLFQGIEIGILIAVIVSLALVVIETLFAPMPRLGLVPGASRRAYRSVRQYPEALTQPGVHVLRIEAPIIFFNAPTVAARLLALLDRNADVDGSDGDGASVGGSSASGSGEPKQRKRRPGGDADSDGEEDDGVDTRAVVLDFSNVPYVDSAFLDTFDDVVGQYRRTGVLLAVANPNSTVLHKLSITPLLKALNSQFGETRDWVFLTVSDAVDAVTAYEPPLQALKLPLDATELKPHAAPPAEEC